jgi:hypothetical protein
MKERPILFNAEMVKAIISGRKTQTRRVLKVQPDEDGLLLFLPSSRWLDTSEREYNCPFGNVGDQLWVRETFSLLGNEDGCPVDWNDNIVTDKKDAARIYKASCWQKPNNYGIWSVPDREIEFDGAWTPSIHMPRWASRIDLLITNVRAERLRSMSEDDARAEGVIAASGPMEAGLAFRELWDSIYGPESWQANPWVWVIEFEHLRAGGKHEL